MSVLAQANERHPQGCEFSTSVPVAEPHKGSKTQKKTSHVRLAFLVRMTRLELTRANAH